jgi:hypothetical protein
MGANWVGHVHRGSIRKLLYRAISKGGYAKQGNREIHVLGDVHRIWTFTGPRFRNEGRIDCLYYDTTVLSLDFVNKRITDGNWRAYNSCTKQTIAGYEDVLFGLFSLNHFKYTYSLWTKPASPNTTYGRFVQRIPWVVHGWFLWEAYDERLADAFHESLRDLQKDQNWRWFDYDWDQDGNWSRRFINPDAERRFRQKEKKWLRISKTTKTTSNASLTPGVPSKLSTPPCASTMPSGFPLGGEASTSLIG